MLVPLKFDRHLDSTATEVQVKFQSDWTIVNTNFATLLVDKFCSMYIYIRSGHNQGSHWRCDYVTDLVFQEKSYKTNLHLFSAYAGVVWSVNKNNSSRDSIFSERSYMYMVIFLPFFTVTAFHFKLTHCSTSCHTKDSFFLIPMTASRKLISTFSNLISSDTKRIDKIM